jgi:hypothetical protein
MTPFTVVYFQENTNTECVQFCLQLCPPPPCFSDNELGLKFLLYVWKIQYSVSAEAGNSWVLLVCLHAYLLAYPHNNLLVYALFTSLLAN